MSRVQTLIVEEGDGDQRLDRWFKRMFPLISQGRIEKMCRKGDLRVDGGRVKASTRLEVGQQVRIPPLPDPGQPAPNYGPRISDADAKMIRSTVIYRLSLHSAHAHSPLAIHIPTANAAKDSPTDSAT